MALVSSTQPSLRARILARFPAQVLAGNGMSITKNGGTYVFATLPYNDVPVSGLEDIPTDTLIGRDSAGSGPPEVVTVGSGLTMNGAGNLGLTQNQRLRMLGLLITNAGTAGIKGDLLVPFACTLVRATLLADATGSVVVDIWKAPYAIYPPVLANSIVGGTPPTISSGIKSQDAVLSGWTTSIVAGDVLRFNVNAGVSGITRLAVALDAVAI